jgi:hypothetical protein
MGTANMEQKSCLQIAAAKIKFEKRTEAAVSCDALRPVDPAEAAVVLPHAINPARVITAAASAASNVSSRALL